MRFLKTKNIDAALFLNKDKNVFYFAGVELTFCILVIPKSKKPFLLVSEMEYEIAKKKSKVQVVKFEKDPFSLVGKVKTLGVDFTKVTLAEFKVLRKKTKAKILDISKDVVKIRLSKSKKEVEKIKKACLLTDDIFKDVVRGFKRFKTEKDVEVFIEKKAKENGGNLAFDTIVASGKNSSMPHYMDNSSKLNKGFCVIDFGVKINGYKSDMTRTIYIGKPSKKEIENYYKVLGVQKEAIKQIREGVDFKKLDKSVCEVLGSKFIHGLGHGLGLDTHEPIFVNSKKPFLTKDSVITIEPGIYFKNKYGIRIEDDVLVKKNGCEVLTKSKKELIIIN